MNSQPEAPPSEQNNTTGLGCLTGFLIGVGLGMFVIDGLCVALLHNWPGAGVSLLALSPGAFGLAMIYFGLKLQDTPPEGGDPKIFKAAQNRTLGWGLIVSGLPIAYLSFIIDFKMISFFGAIMVMIGIMLLLPDKEERTAP